MSQNNLKLDIYNVLIALSLPEELLSLAESEYGYYKKELSREEDLFFSVALERPNYNRLLELPAVKYHQDYIVYESQDKKVRYIDYFGSALVVYDFSKKKSEVFIYAEDSLKAYKILRLAFETLLGEKLDMLGYYRVHCLALDYKGLAYLFLMPPGAGKSTLAMNFFQDKLIRVLGEDMVLYKKNKLYPLNFAWSLREEIGQEKKIINHEKLNFDDLYFQPFCLIKGRRFMTGNCRVDSASRFSLLTALFKSMVLGLELQQSLAFFILNDFKTGFSKSKIGFGRFFASLSLVIRSKCFEAYLGSDRLENYIAINEFILRQSQSRGFDPLKSIYRLIAKIAEKSSKWKLVNDFWLFIYDFSVKIFILVISRYDFVVAVYSKTDLNRIVAGQSDVDLLVIISNSSSEEKKERIKKLNKTIRVFKKILPIIHINSILRVDDFRLIELHTTNEITRVGKHLADFKLILGSDLRVNKIKKEETFLTERARTCYEFILLEIIDYLKNGSLKSARKVREYFFNLSRMFYIKELGVDPSLKELVVFIHEKAGFNEDLIEKNILNKNKIFSLDDAVFIIYTSLKLFENLNFEIDNEKRELELVGKKEGGKLIFLEKEVEKLSHLGTEAIYLSPRTYLTPKERILYIFIPLKDEIIKNILIDFSLKDSPWPTLTTLEENDRVIPLILTEKTLNSPYFFSRINRAESLEFYFGAEFLSGKAIKCHYLEDQDVKNFKDRYWQILGANFNNLEKIRQYCYYTAYFRLIMDYGIVCLEQEKLFNELALRSGEEIADLSSMENCYNFLLSSAKKIG